MREKRSEAKQEQCPAQARAPEAETPGTGVGPRAADSAADPRAGRSHVAAPQHTPGAENVRDWLAFEARRGQRRGLPASLPPLRAIAELLKERDELVAALRERAAAPDLLAALEGLLPLAEAGIPALVARSHPEEQSGHEDGCIAMLDAARAAIAAAKGVAR